MRLPGNGAPKALTSLEVFNVAKCYLDSRNGAQMFQVQKKRRTFAVFLESWEQP